MSGQADGGRSCQPLFGRGWDQPCSLTWGECAWGMRCDAGRYRPPDAPRESREGVREM